MTTSKPLIRATAALVYNRIIHALEAFTVMLRTLNPEKEVQVLSGVRGGGTGSIPVLAEIAQSPKEVLAGGHRCILWTSEMVWHARPLLI